MWIHMVFLKVQRFFRGCLKDQIEISCLGVCRLGNMVVSITWENPLENPVEIL